MYVLVLVLFVWLVRIDPPKFYMLTDQIDKAKSAIERIYHTCGDQIKVNNILTFLKKTSGEQNVEIGFKEALFTDERYVRASRIAIFIMMSQVCTGYYALLAYSLTIFTNEFPADFMISPAMGAYLVATANLLGSVASIFLIHRFGRRTILLVG